MNKTLKNKVCALILICVGLVPMIVDKDATVFIFFLVLAIGLLLEKKNVIT